MFIPICVPGTTYCVGAVRVLLVEDEFRIGCESLGNVRSWVLAIGETGVAATWKSRVWIERRNISKCEKLYIAYAGV